MGSAVEQAARALAHGSLQRHELGVRGRQVAVRNVAGGIAAELATYVVEKGKPFLVVVD